MKFFTRQARFPLWLIGILVIAFFLRIPSFFEPLWYGDEAITLALGEGVRQGLLLYRDIHDNKPPLLYLFAAVAGNLFWLKVILAAWSIAGVVIFWKLAKVLFPQKATLQEVATIIFMVLTTIPLLEGNLANGEIFMIVPTLTSFFILLRKMPTLASIVLAGFIFGIGALFKAPSLIDVVPPIALSFAAVLPHKLSRPELPFGKFVIKTLIFVVGLALPLALTSLYWAYLGAMDFYVRSALIDNLGYLSSWRTGAFSLNNTLAQNQPLITRLLIMATIVMGALFLARRKKITKSMLFVACWFAASLFAVTLSERPYPHYLLQIVPSLSLLIAFCVTNKTIAQFWAYPLFALLGGVLVLFKFYYYPVLPYYQNFLSFVVGNQTREGYFNSFDTRTNRNYKIAQFLSESAAPGEKIFVWGNDPEIYALTHILPPTRFITAYHISDFKGRETTIHDLEQNPPRYIVTIFPASSYPELELLLNKSYTLVRIEEDARVYLRTPNI